MGVLLQICCIFLGHLFLRIPLRAASDNGLELFPKYQKNNSSWLDEVWNYSIVKQINNYFYPNMWWISLKVKIHSISEYINKIRQ